MGWVFAIPALGLRGKVVGTGVEEDSATVCVAPPVLGGTHAEVGGDGAGVWSAQAVDAAVRFLDVLEFVSHQRTCGQLDL
jgi:hypothetical protein